jgi:hypothetical protein
VGEEEVKSGKFKVKSLKDGIENIFDTKDMVELLG